jgi:hypothetical protein
MMTARVRKLALVAHVVSSVGWLGSVASFLALALAGLSNADTSVVRAAYLSMDLTTTYVIIPFCFASLLTGILSSLGTPWGLFRHYWVVVKLVLTIVATLLLLVHSRPIAYLAQVATTATMSGADHRQLRVQLVFDAAAALLLLLVNTALALYKPRGVTRYGWRKQHEEAGARTSASLTRPRSTAG